jgi:AraC-like DNA-binding protein
VAVREERLTLPSVYVRHLGEQLAAAGVDVRGWLGRHSLREEDLDAIALDLSFPGFAALVVDALSSSREPALGLLVGERLVASTHGVVGFAATNSSTLRAALDVFVRFTETRTSLLAISSDERAGRARVRFRVARPMGDVERPVLEAVMLSIKNVIDAISLGSCRVREVVFSFPAPAYASLARQLFDAPIRYAQSWAGLVVPADALDVPLRRADPDAYREAALVCQRELEKLGGASSTASSVRRLLLEKQSGFPSLEAAARLLHVTPRTLHRRLVAEGTAYRDLLEDVRRTLAAEHLKSGRFTVEQIAYLLGYTDLSNFRRAFKRWEGVPPSVFLERTASRREAGS